MWPIDRYALKMKTLLKAYGILLILLPKSTGGTSMDNIREQLVQWANGNLISLDSKNYVVNLEDNFYNKHISQSTTNDINQGSGNETKGKLRALWSSTALVVNFFEYWKNENRISAISSLFGISGANTIKYESKHPTGLSGGPANLDIEFFGGDMPVAIESKFLEPYSKSKNSELFKESYFQNDLIWLNMPACRTLAVDLNKGSIVYTYLAAEQLIKHIISLTKEYGTDGFTLYYLWFDIKSQGAEEHRNEIESFKSKIDLSINFKSMTYNELFKTMQTQLKSDNSYRQYLQSRYFDLIK